MTKNDHYQIKPGQGPIQRKKTKKNTIASDQMQSEQLVNEIKTDSNLSTSGTLTSTIVKPVLLLYISVLCLSFMLLILSACILPLVGEYTCIVAISVLSLGNKYQGG